MDDIYKFIETIIVFALTCGIGVFSIIAIVSIVSTTNLNRMIRKINSLLEELSRNYSIIKNPQYVGDYQYKAKVYFKQYEVLLSQYYRERTMTERKNHYFKELFF